MVLLSFVVLLPVAPWFNAPLLLMALSGLWLMALKRKWLSTLTTLGFFTQLFLCIWVPMVLSLFDAVNFAESLRKVMSFLGFYPAGVLVIACASREWPARRIVIGVASILAIWVLDGIVQFTSGTGLLGFPYEKSRLTGVFYPKYTLGVALAVLAPFCLEAVRQLSSRSLWPAIALIPYVLVILLAGSRSSWGVFTLVVIGYGLYLFKWSDSTNLSLRAIGRVAAIGVLLVVGLSIVFSDTAGKIGQVVGERVAQITPMFSGDKAAIDGALAYRLSLWETGANMLSANWLNGIGPRGYRYVYFEFASEDDHFVRGVLKGTPTHPHLILLEIAVETGLIGVIGYLTFLVLYLRKLARLSRRQLAVVFPPALAVLVAVFPTNVHHSFYGNFSGAVLFWLLMVSMGMIQAIERECSGDSPEEPSHV